MIPSKSILLVSDGNGSFASAVHKIYPGCLITAWFHLSETETHRIYPNNSIAELRRCGVMLKFSQDLFKINPNSQFDVFQFNFPHIGNKSSGKDWISKNESLLIQFFEVAKKASHNCTVVRVTLSTSTIFKPWDVDGCAKKSGFICSIKENFDEEFWNAVGYRHVSNKGPFKGCMEAIIKNHGKCVHNFFLKCKRNQGDCKRSLENMDILRVTS